ncbi:MAG: diacylglycerol/lipid kinase family protein, partial [Chloroflexota bacterium]
AVYLTISLGELGIINGIISKKFSGYSMTSEIVILCNPHANQSKAAAVASRLQKIAPPSAQVEWVFTSYPRHAVQLARQIAEQGCRKLIAMGGDGTVHEVINGVMHLPPEQRPIIGIIPVGSGNDLAGSLKIPADPVDALTLALDGSVGNVDIARIEDDRGHGEYWTNTLGIGFDAVVNIRSRSIRWVRGFLIYFLSALQTILFNHTPLGLQAVQDGKRWQAHLLMLVLCNGRREGGAFWVAPQASPQDGKLDYLGIRRISRLQMLYTIPFVMQGTHQRLPYACQGRFQKLELVSDHPLYIHTDGEIYAGLDSTIRQIRVEAIPSAIRMNIPSAG